MTILVSFLIVMLSAAVQPVSVLQVQPIPSGERAVLRVGEDTELDGGQIRVGLESVVSDSRCPRGYRCISAGEAKVRVWVVEGTDSRRSHLVAGPTVSRYRLSRRYFLQMTSLEPYPEPGRRREQTEYRATFLLTRALDQ